MLLIDRHAGKLVALGFAAALAATIWYVAAFASAFPHDDDWEVLPFTVGLPQYFPVTWEWLWSPHNEHRILLPRLLWIGLVHTFGADPRVLIWLDVALLAATAGVFLRAVHQVRGRRAASDVVIPWALLGLGQYCNILWAFQLMWFLPILLFAVATCAMTRTGGAASAMLAVACTVPMTLCGGPGVLLGAPILAWAVVRAVVLWRTTTAADGRRRGTVGLVVLVVLASACMAVCSAGLERAANRSPLQPWLVLEGCWQFLTVAIGPADGAAMPLVGTILAVLVVGAFGMLLVAGWRCSGAAAASAIVQGQRRATALGVITALAATMLLALVISWGRGPRALGACWLPRYTLAASLFLPTTQLALAFVANGPWRRIAQLSSLALLAVLAWRTPANVAHALRHGEQTTAAYSALADDIRSGLPVTAIARRHYAAIFDWPLAVARVVHFLRIMEFARFGPFADRSVALDLSPEQLEEIAIDPQPTIVVEATFADGLGVGTGADNQLWFRLPRTVRAAELRLEIAVLADHGGDSASEIFWTHADDAVSTWSHRVAFRIPRQEQPQSVVLPLGGHATNWLRLDPSNSRCRFRIAAIKVMALP